jgi:hypothetical protein
MPLGRWEEEALPLPRAGVEHARPQSRKSNRAGMPSSLFVDDFACELDRRHRFCKGEVTGQGAFVEAALSTSSGGEGKAGGARTHRRTAVASQTRPDVSPCSTPVEQEERGGAVPEFTAELLLSLNVLARDLRGSSTGTGKSSKTRGSGSGGWGSGGCGSDRGCGFGQRVQALQDVAMAAAVVVSIGESSEL